MPKRWVVLIAILTFILGCGGGFIQGFRFGKDFSIPAAAIAKLKQDMPPDMSDHWMNTCRAHPYGEFMLFRPSAAPYSRLWVIPEQKPRRPWIMVEDADEDGHPDYYALFHALGNKQVGMMDKDDDGVFDVLTLTIGNVHWIDFNFDGVWDLSKNDETGARTVQVDGEWLPARKTGDSVWTVNTDKGERRAELKANGIGFIEE